MKIGFAQLYNSGILEIRSDKYDTVPISERDAECVKFEAGFITKKKNSKKALLSPEQFMLPNEYMHTMMSPRERDLLFKKYVEVSQWVLDTLQDKLPLDYTILKDIIDIVNMERLHNWVRNHPLVNCPKNIPEKFDTEGYRNTNYSRQQTYLVHEYYELATLVVLIKFIMGPISDIMLCRNNRLDIEMMNKIGAEIVDKILPDNPAVKKIYGFVRKISEAPLEDEQASNIRVYEKRISKEDLITWLVGRTLFFYLSTQTIINDTETSSLPNEVYGSCNSKLTNNTSTAKATRSKNPPGGEVDGEKSATIMGNRRMHSELPIGMIRELFLLLAEIDHPQWSIEKAYNLIGGRDYKYLYEGVKLINKMETVERGYPKVTEEVVAMVFTNYIDLQDIRLLPIRNMYAIAYGWLKENGFSELADHVASYVLVNDGTVISKNSSKSWLTEKHKTSLAKFMDITRETASRKNAPKTIYPLYEGIYNITDGYKNMTLGAGNKRLTTTSRLVEELVAAYILRQSTLKEYNA